VGNAASDPARGATTRRLLDLQAQGLLSTQDVHLAAEGLGVSERTVWRWLRQGQDGQDLTHRSRVRFEVTDELRARLAF
jgi:putative transposase